MKLSSLTVPTLLVEMAAKKACPVCGHGMVNYHYYYKGGFKCKSTSLAAPDVTAAKQAAADLVAAGYPPTLDGLKAQTQGLAPGSTPTTAPTKPKTVSAKSPAAPTVPAAPTQTYAGIQEKIAKWLTTNSITDFTINDDNTVDVRGDLNLDGLRHAKLPVKFNHVTGSVSLAGAMLTTLEGLPEEINGDFDITSVKLDNVTGFPLKIHGDCHLGHIEIASTLATSQLSHVEGDLVIAELVADSLVGLPSYVGGDFIMRDNDKIKTLKGMPKTIVGNCQFPARQLKSFEGITQDIGGSLRVVSPGFVKSSVGLGKIGGSIDISVVGGPGFDFADLPRRIDGNLTVRTNSSGIASLEGFPDEVNGDINIEMNKLIVPGKFNKLIKKMNGTLRIGGILSDYVYNGPDQTITAKNLLSIALIKGIKELHVVGNYSDKTKSAEKLNTLFNRCIQGDMDIHELQEQLIDAGFSQLARL